MPDKLLVYKSDLLPYSETFIKEQVLACRRWSPALVGSHRVEGGLPLDGVDVRLLHSDAPTKFQVLARKLWRETGLAWPGHVDRLRAERARLVHVHFATEVVAMWPALKRLGLPILVTLHGSDIHTHQEWWRRPGAGPASRRYPQRLVEIGRVRRVHFIAVSEAVRARAIEYGLPPERITVRYIGIDLERFRFGGPPLAERAPRVLYVGRMVEKKGGSHLIDAYAALRSRVPGAELAMIGDGPLLESFRAQAAALRVPVEFLGRQSSDVVRREIERASVFCLPSVTAANGDAEGLPIVVMEAQACGLPVVTSARGGATEGILDGVTGFAFPERDAVALADRLTRVLAEPGLAANMSAAAQAFARQRFDIRTCTQALEREYDRIAESARVSPRVEERPA